MKDKFRDYIFLVSFAGVILVLDQWTKWLVRTNLAFQETWSPWAWLEPYARLVHWRNTGAAFGILQSFGNVFMVLSIIVAIIIVYYFPQVPKREWPLRLAMSLQLGGATGNLIDRLVYGHVTDFISVGAFPVFNIADASISVGVVVLVLGVWIKERQQERAVRAETEVKPDRIEGIFSEDPPGE